KEVQTPRASSTSSFETWRSRLRPRRSRMRSPPAKPISASGGGITERSSISPTAFPMRSPGRAARRSCSRATTFRRPMSPQRGSHSAADAAKTSGANERPAGMKSFALALGGGGARGLAQIAVLEAIDEMGVKPVAIAGTSIGALVGAAYAAGMSAKDIRRHVIAVAHDPGEIWRRLIAARAGSLGDLFAGAFGQATQLDAEKFCAQFLPPEVPA